MDELKMDGIEIPELDGNYDDLPDPSAAEPGSPEAFGIKEPEDSTMVFDDLDDYEFDPLAAPVLSEMDGSEVMKAEEKPEPQKPETEAKPAMSIPAFEEMGGAAVTAQAAPKPQQSYSSPSSYQPVSSTQKSSAYQPAPSNSGYSQSSAPKASMDDFYAMRGDNELFLRGEKTVKRISIVLIVFSVLNGLTGLLIGAYFSLLLAICDIVFLSMFKKGSERARWYLGVGCAVSAVDAIKTIIGFSSVSSIFVELGITFVYSIVQFIIIIFALVMGVLTYFFLIDKSVGEYCEKMSYR